MESTGEQKRRFLFFVGKAKETEEVEI